MLVGTYYKNDIKSDERTFYDGLGRVVQSQTAKTDVYGAGDRDIVTTVAYDARGLEVCRATPYPVAPYVYNASNPVTPFRTATCASRPDETTTAYDALGRPLSVSAPDGSVTHAPTPDAAGTPPPAAASPPRIG